MDDVAALIVDRATDEGLDVVVAQEGPFWIRKAVLRVNLESDPLSGAEHAVVLARIRRQR
ncbi:hypothetical protein UK23_23325 [Lentzea aerocolonigenes]|uniref:Uncharacterized protein n=1 Tax=Lentzea aerocolonigenes TaxID=68170 RepID=A0A0F0GT89_LENAE|nr:hypothetical protein UK23_23325 [Lentzea aerocolonigenes]